MKKYYTRLTMLTPSRNQDTKMTMRFELKSCTRVNVISNHLSKSLTNRNDWRQLDLNLFFNKSVRLMGHVGQPETQTQPGKTDLHFFEHCVYKTLSIKFYPKLIKRNLQFFSSSSNRSWRTNINPKNVAPRILLRDEKLRS